MDFIVLFLTKVYQILICENLFDIENKMRKN